MSITKEMNFVSAVVYFRNDKKRTEEFLHTLLQVLKNNFKQYEIILVDDASEGETRQIVCDTAAKHRSENIQIIHLSHYQGRELAMNAGLDLAIGDFVFEFDSVYADYPAEVIMAVYFHCLKGFDIVSASPNEVGCNGARWFYHLYNGFAKNKYQLKEERFRILSRRVINRIYSMSKTIPYRKAVYINCGLHQDTIYYERQEASVIDFDKEMRQYRMRTAIDVLILFTDIGYKTALYLTVGMIVFSILVALYSIFIFTTRQPILGWTSIILFLSLGFAGIFAVAAIIIKYLDILLGLNFKKKTYLVDSIEKF